MTFRLAKYHPAIRFIFDGQSLNNQPGSSQTDPRTLPFVSTRGLGYKTVNKSIGGASYTELLNEGGFAEAASTRVHPIFRHSANVIYVCVGGSSDIAFEDDAAATAMADTVTYTDAARAAAATYGTGIYIIVCTMPPIFNLTVDEETQRLAYNDLLMADADGDFDAVVDLTENEAGPLANADDTTYYFDGVHWTAAGAAYAASLVRPAIVSILTT